MLRIEVIIEQLLALINDSVDQKPPHIHEPLPAIGRHLGPVHVFTTYLFKVCFDILASVPNLSPRPHAP